MSQLSAQVSTQLQTTKSLLPTHDWLASFLASQRPTTPLPALVSTATFRLLASDITTTLVAARGTCFPAEGVGVEVREWRLGEGVVMTQVLVVEDMSKSRWEQVEAIEALERGEGTKGREIIRVTAPAGGGEEGGGDDGAALGGAAVAGTQRGGGGPHKLLLQDASGRKMWGIELKRVEGVGIGMCIGCKLLIKGAVIARGMVLLEPETTSVVGGKVEDLQRKWREERKMELKAQLEAAEGRGTG